MPDIGFQISGTNITTATIRPDNDLTKNSKPKVKIAKFGTFILKKKNERIGRNPKTKEEKIISERNVILFKPSKELKKFINQND